MNTALFPEVKVLLQQYEQYTQLAEQKALTSHALAKAKLKGETFNTLQDKYSALRTQLQALSDAMTFAGPDIWMQYKYEAYKQEAHPIRTMSDFRVHCSKPDYICTKRYTFLNQRLVEKGEASLTDTHTYPDTLSLDEVLRGPAITNLLQDDNFMKDWATYEYHTADGRVAKWENFR